MLEDASTTFARCVVMSYEHFIHVFIMYIHLTDISVEILILIKNKVSNKLLMFYYNTKVY